MSQEPVAIDIQSVGLRYGKLGSPFAVQALTDVSFSVPEKQFVSILGLSGCGKSSLLKLTAGLLSPTSGELRVAGNSPEGARRERTCGFVFQAQVVLPWRSTLDNVALLLETQGVNKQERYERSRQYLSMVGLSDFEQHRPRQLSGGMQQRVSIARALSMEPSILLMDEPFGALDAITRDRMGFDLLDICQRTNRTVLFVTHSVAEAVLLSDTVVVLSPRPGTVQAIRHIDLPRPRSRETRLSPEFTAYTHQLLQDLEGLSG
jgi:NitT/TauT family transport system ATP-binding protein